MNKYGAKLVEKMVNAKCTSELNTAALHYILSQIPFYIKN